MLEIFSSVLIVKLEQGDSRKIKFRFLIVSKYMRAE